MSARFLSIQLASAQDAALFVNPIDTYTIEEIDTYLPGYKPFGGWRADEVAQAILVDKDQGKYRKYDLANVFRLLKVETSYQAKVGEVDPSTSLATYATIQRALGSFIPDDTRAQQGYDVEKAAARRIQDALVLERENRVWELLDTSGSWNALQRTTITSDYFWDTGAQADPIADLQRRMRASHQPVTGTYLGLRCAHALLGHPKTRDYCRFMLGDAQLSAAIQQAAGATSDTALDFSLPGLPPFHIVGAKKLNETTGDLDELLSRDVVMVSNPPGDPQDFDRIQTIKTFRVRGPSGTGFTTRMYRVEDRGLNGGDMLVSGHNEVIAMVADNAGGLIINAIGA
jgi:hypothetical protein